ncbi:MAG: TetR/AcrR family transcriptional regulator, partial [Clostridia bacterium]|nr:TetR/AcrR family transcriptional regulator [Clostridia bacterium]
MNRSESNNLTRECITTALLIIIREKDYDEITITDITEKAGVSRMAYYRNYKSKD